MNAAIGGAQLLGLWITLIRLEFSFKEVLHHGLRVMGVLIVCLAFTFAGWWASGTPLLRDYPVTSLIFAPVAMLLAMGTVLKLKLASLPERLSNRLRALWPLSSENQPNI
jgi:hypothetical protein